MLDISEELKRLEASYLELVSANEELGKAKRVLREFELGIRKHCGGELKKESNAQKMQIAFEQFVAQNEENFQYWIKLQRDVDDAQVRFDNTRFNWEFNQQAMETYKIIMSTRKGNA